MRLWGRCVQAGGGGLTRRLRLGLSSLAWPDFDLLLEATALGFSAFFLELEAFLDDDGLEPKKALASTFGPLFCAGFADAYDAPPDEPLLENEVSISGSTWPRFISTACL